MYHSKSKLKQRVAIAGAAAGGSLIGGILIFFLMIPFRVESIVKNIEGRFMANVSQSVGEQTGNFVSRYIAHSIMPSIAAGKCRSTIDPSCVVVPDTAGPFKQFWTALSDGKFERRLAENGIVIGKQGGNSFYMTVGDENFSIDNSTFLKLRNGDMSIFDLPELKASNRTEIRKAVKETTQWYNMYTRYKLGKLLESKYGIKRCIWACSLRDKIADKTAEKILAAKGTMINRLMPEKYAFVLSCVIGGVTGTCDPTHLDNATATDTERLSPYQREMQKQMAELASKFGREKLEDLVKVANEVSDDGVKRVLIRKAVSKIIGKIGGEAAADAATKATEKFIPVWGWVRLGAGIVSGAAGIAALLSVAGYQNDVATGVEAYQTLNTVSAEMKSGNTDAAFYGNFDHMLATNISGDKTNSSEFSQSIAWQHYFNTSTPSPSTASIFNALLPSAHAADPNPNARSTYRCDDNNPVPAGKLVCPEEEFGNSGNHTATAIADSLNAVPGLVPVAKAITELGDIPSNLIEDGLKKIPGYNDFAAWVGKATSSVTEGPLGWLQSKLIQAPTVDSGARFVDMAMAGADAAGNASCRIQLGCAKVSDQAMADIQNQQIADEKAEFQSRPLFARVFSTDTQYSLVSHLALAMPSTVPSALGSSISSLLTNPFHKLGSTFSSLFASNRAFAATQPEVGDPFGIIQYAYLPGQIPKDPDRFWTQNCMNGPLAKSTSIYSTLDISDWLNTQEMDPVRGEAVAKTPNPCLLVQTTLQSMGPAFDSKAIPEGAGNPDPPEGPVSL